MILRPVHPAVGDGFAHDAPDARERIAGLYAPPRQDWLRLNLIASVDGSATGADGTSDTLSNPADRRILGVIRSQADVVLIGAQTLRAEGYLLPRRAHLAVATTTGELGGAHPPRADGNGGGAVGSDRDARTSVLVLGPASVEERARATMTAAEVEFLAVEPGDDGRPSAADLLATLRAHGARSIVCEGGPALAGQVLATGQVDEICLSTSPRIAATGLSVFGAERAAAQELLLGGLLVDEAGGLYARWLTRAS
ncbi:dihydrofolate reductase family protein [Schumannella sp. 10F1B-5-1]|uniref:dihydrofolate reductase family protein n=1 Tax=Schumannella sp. 10F1B-5-1 TaxID=2590780 RepID=UPI00112FF23B|nr:dihydrofolate reductase family protein [Schumannella sp. 10F1B-5-1]TPW70888.1 pyrimidine reductase [Schumannella sp. 10F1B-5-1]